MRSRRGNSEPAHRADVGMQFLCLGVRLPVLILCMCLAYATHVEANPPVPTSSPSKHVLILHAYHQGLDWTDREDEGIRSVLDQHSDILVSTEYLDSKRLPLEDIKDAFADYLRRKYEQSAFDAIIATDNSALTFLARHRHDLFPEALVVFCGVNNFQPSMLDAFDGRATGVVEEWDSQGTLDLIEAVQPKLPTLTVVSGVTPTAQAVRQDVEEALKQQKRPFDIVWITGPDTATLRARLVTLSEQEAVLLCGFNRDANQLYYSFEECARLISQASKAPVYAMHDVFLGTGVLGGCITYPSGASRQAAELCLQVLQTGEIPPPITNIATVATLDYDVLVRFGWSAADAPGGARILNRPTTFYERHKTLIIETALAFLILLLVLLAVIYGLLRARSAARLLLRSEERLSTTLNSIGDAVISTDLDGKVTHMNPVAEELTGWSLTDAQGKPLSETFKIINAKTRLPASDPVQSVIENGRSVGLANHTMLIAKDGTEYQIADSASPIRVDDETMTGVVLVFRDVTEEYHIQEELHQALDSLRLSERQRREAQEMAKLGHWYWDVETGEVNWSAEVFDIFRLDPKEFTPQIDSIMALSPWPEDSQRHTEIVERAIKDRERGFFEQRFLRPDGSTGHYASTFEGVYDDNDELIAMKGTVQDITERRQAEKMLRLTQRSVDQSKDAALWVRMDGQIIYANNAACESLGYTPEELLNLKIPDIDTNWPADAWDEKVIKLKEEGSKRFASEQRRKDGSLFPVEVSVNYVEAEGEGLFLAFCTDITQQRQQEERLLASEQRFRELFNNMASGVAVYEAVDDGADFVFVDFNRAGERIEKVSRDDLIGKRVTELFPGVEEFGLLDVFRRVWRTGKPEDHPITLYADHRIAGWRENFVYRLASGEVVAVYDDVTERMRALEERDRLFNHSIDMLCIAGFDGHFQQVNPAFSKVLGWSAEELTERQWLEFVHPDDVDATVAVGEKLSKGAVTHAFENRYRCEDGSYRWLSWNAIPLVEQGQIFAVCRDITEQKEAAEALRQSEERYSLAQRLSGVGTWEWNVLTNEVYWSDEVIAMCGYKPGEFSGTLEEVAGRVHPDDLDRWQENVRACVEDGKEHNLEFRMVWPNGSVHWLAAIGDAERDSSGKATRLVGVLLDITERRNAEEALRDSERRHRDIFESNRDGFAIVDEKGLIIDANQAYCDMVGYTLDELKAMEEGFYAITPEKWRKWEAEEIIGKQLLVSGYSGLYKKEYIHKDGRIFPIEVQAYCRMSEGGNPECIWGIARDITEREQAEEALRESEQRHREIFDSSRDGFVIVSPEGEFLNANQAYCDMLGYSLEELREKPDFYAITPKRWHEWEAKEIVEKRLLEKGYSGLYKKEYIRKDGTVFAVELQSYARMGEDGKPEYLWGIVRDITEREEAEAYLRESERSKAVLLSNLPGMSYRCAFNREWTMEFVSSGCRELTGWDVEDLLHNRTLSFNDLIPPEYHEELWEAWQSVVREHGRAQLEYEIITRSGERKWLWEQGVPVYDDDGNVVALEGLLIDITDRKRAEQELASTMVFLDTIVNESPFAMWVARPDGNIIRTNRSLRETLNLADDQIVGHYNVLQDENIQKQGLDKAVRAVFEEGTPARFNLEWHAAEAGDVAFEQAYDLHIDVAMFPIGNASGELSYVVCQWLDVTARVRAEEAVKNSERLLHDIIQGTPVAAFVIGKDHNVLHWNRALAELSHIPEDAVLGTTDQWRAFYPTARPCLADVVLDQDYEALETYYGGKYRDSSLIPEAYEATDFFPNMGEDGRWLRFTVALIRDAEGEAVGAVEMLVDITDRVRAEEALRESEDKHRTLFETMAQGVLYRDAEGRITDANPAALEILGVSFDELVQRGNLDEKWQTIREDGSELHVQDHPSLRALHMGEVVHNVIMGVYNEAADAHRWLNVNAVPRFRPGDDKPYQIYTTFDDITDRKREAQVTVAQLRLIEFSSGHSVRELLQKFLDEAELLTGSRAGFYHFLEEDQETLSLQAWSSNTLNGMCTAEGAGAHYPVSQAGVWVDCIHERKPVIHNDYQSLSHKKGLPPGHAPISRELVVPVLRRDKIVAILGVGNKHIDYNQGDLKILQQLADLAWEIVVRKQAEEKLRESEERFRVIFEQASVGVAVIETQTGRFARVNQRYADIVGYSREEMQTLNFQKITHPEDLAEDVENMERMVRGEITEFSMEKRYYHKNGSIVWVNLFVSAMWDPDETPEYHIAVVEDITERKRAEDELAEHRQHLEELIDARTRELEAAQVELLRRERLATLGRLTATVSHELRNPLGTIRGSLFTINRATKDSELGIERALARAQRNIDRCDGIISELLDYTRSTVPEPELTNLDEWLAEILDEQEIPEGVTLERSLRADLEIPLDREKLRRCVVNLLTNACQAIQEQEPGEGRVTVESERKDDRIEVRILDTGPGIASDLQEKIFEPLYSTKGFGVGLGLSIVKQLIEAAGGGISIASTPGAGTHATLWLQASGMQGPTKQQNETQG